MLSVVYVLYPLLYLKCRKMPHQFNNFKSFQLLSIGYFICHSKILNTKYTISNSNYMLNIKYIIKVCLFKTLH